jgi:cytosine/adenosine deaminase-related metal-dependent hydrolase
VIWGRSVSLVNAGGAFGVESVRFTAKILALNEPPRRGDTVFDLSGAFILPGLVNAHDHLELNHYGRLKFRERYANASEWIGDMRPRLDDDPSIRVGRHHALTERLFIGGLKNVLAGVTTVAHHNPYYSELRRTMPLRVVRRYGWAHSFALEHEPVGARGEPGGNVAACWHRTGTDVPFFVHIAEGIDETARSELPKLEATGSLASNTVLVHGVAIDEDGLRRVNRAGAGLVWCPGSNTFLFGRTAGVRALLDTNGRRDGVALGSDSRLTGSNDLLDELRVAHDTGAVSADELLDMVTSNAARMLRLHHGGRLIVGQPADFIVIPKHDDGPAAALLATRRHDLALVVIGGRPMVADARFAAAFSARSVTPRSIAVDRALKIADSGLARRIAGCPIIEPGVAVA